MILGFFAYLYSERAITMEKRKTWWLLLSVAIVNVVGGVVVQALVWIGPVFRSQSSAVGQWLLLWNLVQGLLVVASGYLGVSSYLKEQRKATRATEVELFDHTVKAVEYFDRNLVPELNKTLNDFHKLLQDYQPGKSRKQTQRYLLVTLIKQANFDNMLRRLNVLSGYAHYGMVNEPQLYSSISDELSGLTKDEHYLEILAVYRELLLMNNYIDLLASVDLYVRETEARRNK